MTPRYFGFKLPPRDGHPGAIADALRNDGVSDPHVTADRLIKLAKARHRDIAWAIASDAGVRLMRDAGGAVPLMFAIVTALLAR